MLRILFKLMELCDLTESRHEYDSCCFRGAGLFDEIKDYNTYVQSQVQYITHLKSAPPPSPSLFSW